MASAGSKVENNLNETPWANRNYYRLESESSGDSSDGTESIYSIQGAETELVRDTSDTSSLLSEVINIEYEIASSLSEDDDPMVLFDSTGSDFEEMIIAAVAADSSIENFLTDAEDDSDSSVLEEEFSLGLLDFGYCIKCKAPNTNPQVRYCSKCFQDRKAFFPPRPPPKKSKVEKKQQKPEKLSSSGPSSQDSGVGSCQELTIEILEQPSTSSTHKRGRKRRLSESSVEVLEQPSCSAMVEVSRKRQLSESSLSDEYETPKKKAKEESKQEDGVSVKDGDVTKSDMDGDAIKTKVSEWLDSKNDCVVCNSKTKDGVFLHGKSGHMCCCYKCAIQSWKASKRCPVCNRQVSNVIKLFS